MEDKGEFIHPFMSFRGKQYRFYIHDFEEKERISKLIKWGYGIVDKNPGGEYTLELASPDYNAGDREVYSIEYIIACCAKRKTLNIKNFRLNKISTYSSDFEPMSVLEHCMSWSEAEKYRKEKSPEFRSSSSSTNTEYDSDEICAYGRNNLQDDHEKIIECIMEYKAYNLVHGKDFWRMLEKQVWKNRRKWHYLKQEFYEKILPNIESFKLTESEIASFKRVRNDANRWLHKRNRKDNTLCRKNGIFAVNNKSCLEYKEVNEEEEVIVLGSEDEEKEISRRPATNHHMNNVCHEKPNRDENVDVVDLESFERINTSRGIHKRNGKTDTCCRKNRMCATKSTPCMEKEKRNEAENVVMLDSEEEKEEIPRRRNFPANAPVPGEASSTSSEDLGGKSMMTKKKCNLRKAVNLDVNNEVDPEEQTQSSNQEEEDVATPSFKRKAKYYSEKEDKALLNFISSSERYRQAGGVKLWKLMEKKQVVPGRSWQSMKERYRKVLIAKLDNYLLSNKVNKLKKSQLTGVDLIKNTKKRRVGHSSTKIANDRIKTNHRPGLKCTCCFDFGSDEVRIEVDTENKNKSSRAADAIISEVAVTRNSEIKSKHLNSVMPNVSKENEQVQVTNKGPKRKLFSQRQSLSEFTPISDDEKVIYHSIKPHKLFEKKKIGEVIVKKPESSDNIVTKRKINPMGNQNEKTEDPQNRKCYVKDSESQAISKLIVNDKSSKTLKQHSVHSTAAKGDRIISDKHNATEDIPDTRIRLSNNKDKNNITTVGACISESEEELVNNLLNIDDDIFTQICETQNILGNTYIDEMLDGKKIESEVFQQNETVINKENNVNDKSEKELNVLTQNEEQCLQTECNSDCNQNVEMLDANTLEKMQENVCASAKEGEMISSSNSDFKNISSELEEEMPENTLRNTSTQNTSSEIYDSVTLTNKEKFAEDNKNIKEMDSYKKQNRVEENSQIENSNQEKSSQVFYTSHCNGNVEITDTTTVRNIEDNISASNEENYISHSSNFNILSDIEEGSEEIAHNLVGNTKENTLTNKRNKNEKEHIDQNKNVKEINKCRSQSRGNECIEEAKSQVENDEDIEESHTCEISNGSSLSKGTRSTVAKDSSYSILKVTETLKFQSELHRENIPHCALEFQQGNEISNADNNSHDQNSEEKSFGMESKENINRDPADDHNEIESEVANEESRSRDPAHDHNELNSSEIESEVADDELNSDGFSKTDSLQIHLSDEKSSSADNSDCENISRKSENNGNRSKTQFAVNNQRIKEMNENVILDNSKRNEKEFYHVNDLINSNCENEIFEKAEELNVTNDVSNCNGANNNNIRNSEKSIHYLKNLDVSCEIAVAENSQNVDIKDTSIVLLDNKCEDELLSEDILKKYIQQLLPGKFELVSKDKYEILNLPQMNVLLEAVRDSDENFTESINHLDDKGASFEMSALNIFDENKNSVPQYSINDSDINLSEKIKDCPNVDKIQNVSNEKMKCETGMADSVYIDNHLTVTEIMKQDIKGNELSEDNEHSCVTLQGKIYKQEIDVLLDHEIKKQDYENSHNTSSHLTEHAYCLQGSNTSSERQIQGSSYTDSHSSKTICKQRFKSKKQKRNIKGKSSYLSGNRRKLQNNLKTSVENMGEEHKSIESLEFSQLPGISCPERVTSDQLLTSDSPYSTKCSSQHSSSLCQESLSPWTCGKDSPCQTKGVRQQSFYTKTSNIIKKRKSLSHSYHNKKLSRETRSYSSTSSGESSKQFTDSSTTLSIDSRKHYDRQMSNSDSLYERSTSDQVRKGKKLRSDDHNYVSDSGLGMEPQMDEVNYRPGIEPHMDEVNCQHQSEVKSNMQCTVKKTKLEHCAIN